MCVCMYLSALVPVCLSVCLSVSSCLVFFLLWRVFESHRLIISCSYTLPLYFLLPSLSLSLSLSLSHSVPLSCIPFHSLDLGPKCTGAVLVSLSATKGATIFRVQRDDKVCRRNTALHCSAVHYYVMKYSCVMKYFRFFCNLCVFVCLCVRLSVCLPFCLSVCHSIYLFSFILF